MVRQFLPKSSHTTFTLATRKLKRLKALLRFKNEICCIDLAYIDELAKDNKGVKHLLVHQDLIDGTVGAKGMKTKNSQETVRAFLTIITKKHWLKKNWVEKGTEFAVEIKKKCKAEGIQIYSRWVRPRPHLLNKQNAHWKYFLPLHGRQWIQVHSLIDSIRYNTKF